MLLKGTSRCQGCERTGKFWSGEGSNSRLQEFAAAKTWTVWETRARNWHDHLSAETEIVKMDWTESTVPIERLSAH